MEKKIDALFTAWQQGLCPGGQVLVIHKGKTVYEKCFGYANLETRTPMTENAVFHAASVTKQFTAMSIMLLQERGLLDVDKDVRCYIPDLIRFPEPLTLRQMLNMVSGIRGYYELLWLQGRHHEDHYAQQELQRMIGRQTKLNFAPGSEFVYTNANYMLLATVVERLSGMSFPDFVAENILQPLGMDHSFIRDDPHRLIPDKVSSYHDDGFRFTNAILTFGIYGGTSLHTTSRDLAKFMCQYKNPTLVSRETFDSVALTFPMVGGKQSNYGAGVIKETLEGHLCYHHGGVNAGYRAIGMCLPEDDLIITIFTNTYNTPPLPAAKNIARIVLGLPEAPFDDLARYAQPTVDLSKASGIYYHEGSKEHHEVQVRDGIVYWNGDRMVPVAGNRYRHGRRQVLIALQEGKLITRQGPAVKEYQQLSGVPEEPFMVACQGNYYCEDMQGHYEVVFRDGGLWMENLRHGPQRLYWLGENRFFYDKFFVRFVQDPAGKVTGYLVDSPHLRNVEFRRV